MSNRAAIALLLYPIVNAVVFGVFAVSALSFPDMADNAKVFLIAAIETSLIIALPLAWLIAPQLQAQRIPARSRR